MAAAVHLTASATRREAVATAAKLDLEAATGEQVGVGGDGRTLPQCKEMMVMVATVAMALAQASS